MPGSGHWRRLSSADAAPDTGPLAAINYPATRIPAQPDGGHSLTRPSTETPSPSMGERAPSDRQKLCGRVIGPVADLLKSASAAIPGNARECRKPV
jgi:hypothetical protein